MKIAIGRGLLILLSFSLVISIFVSIGPIGDAQASGPTYAVHPPIRIVGNSDLVTLKASGGCTGSGTIIDPYVISGYDISGTGGACIYVSDITVRLVVRDCYLHGNTYGIQVLRSNYVIVTNNNCSGNVAFGIFLDFTGNDTLTNNVCIDAAHGIYTWASSDNIMENNSCRATNACAIMLAGSSNRNILSNNTCYSSGDNGIYVLHSDSNTLSNNTLRNNLGHGIDLADSDFNNVYGNDFIGNNGATSIYNSSHPQGEDTSIGNHWNTGSYGNHWSDWTTPDLNGDGIVDNPYSIVAGIKQDNYPLANPGTTVPGVPTGLTATAGNGQLGLTWSAPSGNGGVAIDYYAVYQDGVDVKHVTSTSTTISGLTNGHSYSFKVAAHNPIGLGAKSAGISSIPYTVPDSPTGLTILPADAQATLDWTAPSFNGGVAIDYYVVYQDGVDVKHVTSTSTTISGLTNGRPYSFAVAAHNPAGIGAQTPAVSTTPYTVPGAPTGLTATAGDGQVGLTWSAPGSNGGAAIDYYIIRQDGVALPNHLSGLTTVITGLVNGQTYSFTVSAHNLAGLGSQSAAVTAKPASPPAVPGAPTSLVATPANAQVSLIWIAPSDDGNASIDYYIVYLGGIDVAHPTSNSKTILDLTNGQSYTFTVAAHNSIGTGPQCNPVLAIPLTIPGTPSGLLATPGDGYVSLSWSSPLSNGGASIDYYVVYRNGTDIAHPAFTNMIVTGLMNGVSYTFKVAAHNPAGMGLQTSGVSATPDPIPAVPGAPSALIATPGDSQVSLSWSAPGSDGGATIDYYLIYVNGVVRSGHLTAVTSTVTGLSNGQQYTFTVAAHNSVGTGSLSSAVNATPSPSPTVPGAPTGLIATPGNTQITLSWEAPNNNGGAAVDYYIVYQNGVDTFHSTTASKIATGLINGQSYNFTVAAHNSIGAGVQTAAVTATPIMIAAPGIPANLITAPGNNMVALSWTAPSGSSDIDYYIVYLDGVDVSHTSATSATITGLTNGDNYSIAVAAHNSGGVGILSPPQIVSPSANGGTTTSGYDAIIYFSGILAILLATIVVAFLVVRRGQKSQKKV